MIPGMPASDDSGAIQRRRPPSDSAWQCAEVTPQYTRWFHPPSGARVLSAVETPDRDIGPEWHVSVTVLKPLDDEGYGRAGRGVVAIVCRDFGMRLDGEDNHVRGGKARHFWLAVNADKVAPCPCRDTERAEVTPIPGVGEDGDEFIYRQEPAQ